MSERKERKAAGLRPGRLRAAYDALPPVERTSPKRDFVEELMRLCMVSETTVRGWLAGTYRPDALRRRLLAERLDCGEDELFGDEADLDEADGTNGTDGADDKNA